MPKFLLTNGFRRSVLLLVFFCAWEGVSSETTFRKECFIEATYKVTNTGNSLFDVVITADKGRAPYKYIFYKETGHLISKDFSSNEFAGLKAGKYLVVVADANNCRKDLQIEIK